MYWYSFCEEVGNEGIEMTGFTGFSSARLYGDGNTLLFEIALWLCTVEVLALEVGVSSEFDDDGGPRDFRLGVEGVGSARTFVSRILS